MGGSKGATGGSTGGNSDPIYDTYVARRQKLEDAEFSIGEKYDHWLLTLAGGAIGLSITLVDHLDSGNSGFRIFLAIAWGLLTVAIMIGLASMHLAQKAYQLQRTIMDRKELARQNQQPPPQISNRFTKITNALNWTSLFFFIGGLIALCIFTYATPMKGKKEESMKQPNSIVIVPSDFCGRPGERPAPAVPPDEGPVSPPNKKP